MTTSSRFVTISCFRGELNGFVGAGRDAIVAVDVIRATTTAITAVALGRRCFPVASLAAAARLEATLDRPLMAGELGGHMPHGFDITNSPAAVTKRTDISRPMILLSSSGTQLVCAARGNVYLACLRNYGATIDHLALHHENVMLVGAGTRGEAREEDTLCCAWLAAGLVSRGYRAEDKQTEEIIDNWGARSAGAFVGNKSTEYLRTTNQLEDLQFILEHVDDLDCVVQRIGDEVARLDDRAGQSAFAS